MVFKRLDRICQDVIGRVNTDELGGCDMTCASPEEEPIEAEAPTGVTGSEGGEPLATDDREESGRRSTLPGMQKQKRPTRSGNQWTVRKPGKSAPAETGASKGSKVRTQDEAVLHFPPTIGRSMIAAKPTRLPPTSAAVIDLVMWKAARVHSPSLQYLST